MGLTLSMGYGREYTSIIPLLFGSFSSLSGIGPLGYMMAASGRSDRLYDKVTQIYEQMGPEFKEQVEQERKLEERRIPADMDYSKLDGLRLEAREKLEKIKPLTVGMASRISGVNPADITVLLMYLK